MNELEILVKPYVTVREGVAQLIDRASELDADLIVTTTHARKGVTRWLIGSFAEALTEQSQVPVFVINPESETKWDFSSAVFATDFSDESWRAFGRFLPLAKALKSKILLYHKVSFILSPRLDAVVAAGFPSPASYEERSLKSRSRAEEWARAAQEKDVEVQLKIDPILPKTPADATIAEALERGAWIAIAARSKSISDMIVGNTARRILRNSPVPVWIFRST